MSAAERTKDRSNLLQHWEGRVLGLSSATSRKVLSDRPALKPDWGKPTGRNFREEDGNGSYPAIPPPERPVASGRDPHACACGGVRRRVSHQGGRRGRRGNRGERGPHRAARRRLRESSPCARARCDAGRIIGGQIMVIHTRPEMSHPRQDMTHAHQTAPTQFVEANGVRFAYRRFGKTGGVPLVFNQHFMGTMDHWDPAVTDGLAKTREVILFNNAGVSSSSGEVPISCEQMGTNAVSFIRAIGLPKVDVLGFSIGGFVAQKITLQATDLVGGLFLVGNG